MVRSIVATQIVRPVYRSQGRDVEGPDEDSFTLTVHALEALGESSAGGPEFQVEKVHVVGDLSDRSDWAIREALGRPRLEVQHHLPGTPSLFASLSQAAHERGGQGVTCVVAVDSSRGPDGASAPESGAGAIAFVFREGTGAIVTGHGQRAHPAHLRPNATDWAEAAVRGSGVSADEGTGATVLLTEVAPPVLEATWTRLHPRFPARSEPLPSRYGSAPTVGAACRLAELLGHLAAGESAIVARVESDQTHFLGLRADGPVAPPGEAQTGPEVRAPVTSPSIPPGGLLSRVSEGAYVPYPTYRENLPSRWRFVAERCEACARRTFPARHRCRHCGESKRLIEEELPRSGLPVEAITTVRPGAQPTEFDPQVEAGGAYDVAIVRLAPEVRVTLQLTDHLPGVTRVGALVSTRLRRLYPMEGEWRYGRKAIPQPSLAPAPPSPS